MLPRMITLLLLAAGCQNPDDGKDTSGDTGGDTGNEDVVVDLTPTAVQSPDISTVLTVRWTTPAEGTRVVEYGTDTRYGSQSTDDGSTATDHTVMVAGLPTQSDVHWRVRSVIDGVTHVSADQVVTTEVRDQDLPDLELGDVVEGAYHKGLRLMPITGSPNPIVLVDDTGDIVWWTYADEGYTVSQAWLDVDGTHVLYMVADDTRKTDKGAVIRVPLDHPQEQESIRLTMGHHSFFQLPNGHLVYFAADIRPVEDQNVVGDAIIEVDADGANPRTIFNTWDRWTPDLALVKERDSHFYRQGMDWTHGNSLRYNAADESIVASFHNLDTVLKVKLDGTVDWVIGATEYSPESTYTFTGEDSAFSDQHNAHELANGNVLMLDNGPYCSDVDCYSEATEYALDDTNGTFTEVWNYEWTRDNVVFLMGDVQRFEDDGNTLINWGAKGELMEVTQSGEVVWDLYSALGAVFAFGNQYETVGGVVR